ncbi:MAG: glycerol-3-phosphate 1-O-acyltransferase PlsY [Kangiellaceae bacterium]|jgi:glycerol-3-phosphate acyltransferase PlsY|nr:glycerol-3-phosphate 1-O-acyltransferase PlsY [Kangiellaceae bacterium]
MDIISIILIILAYLMGSLSAAIIVCRLLGLGDPRDSGSGNPGATNVLRIGGKKAAILTLIGDMLKGVVPVLTAIMLDCEVDVVGLVALAAFVGHLWPAFFQFKGGKGVATFFGVIYVMNWQLGVFATVTWILVTSMFHISSLSALITATVVPIYAFNFFPQQAVYLAIICALLILRHHKNIRQLISGEENRLSSKKTS